jgi:phospholipase C
MCILEEHHVKKPWTVAALAGIILALVALSTLRPNTGHAQAVGIHKIQHVIIIMQENRSFDSYFGTYPGADGIPMANEVPTVCVPDPRTNQCVKPYHDTQDRNQGGPHAAPASTADVDGGKMDGFIAQQEKGNGTSCAALNPQCSAPVTTSLPDAMGYHDGSDIPPTGRMPGTSCCRTTCSSLWPPGASPLTSIWSLVGRPSAPVRPIP